MIKVKNHQNQQIWSLIPINLIKNKRKNPITAPLNRLNRGSLMNRCKYINMASHLCIYLTSLYVLDLNILIQTSKQTYLFMSQDSNQFHLSSPTKSKRIRKPFEPKSGMVLRHPPTKSEDSNIYESEEEEPHQKDSSFDHGSISKKEEKEQSDGSWSEDRSDSLLSSQMMRIEGFRDKATPIFKSEHFEPVEEIDFELYTTLLARTKIYGALLSDQFGRILWCDKASHELLQGSLNNFQKAKLTHFLLASQLKQFLHEMSSIRDYNQKTTLQWIIYSKNSKRRFFQVPLSVQPVAQDLFYRFLKHITLRIRPISINLPHYRDPNGFCNEQLVPQRQPERCFFLELRHAKKAPSLKHLNLFNDPVIKKFIVNTKAKHHKKHKETSPSLISSSLQLNSPQTIDHSQQNIKEEEEQGRRKTAKGSPILGRELKEKGIKASERKKRGETGNAVR